MSAPAFRFTYADSFFSHSLFKAVQSLPMVYKTNDSDTNPFLL